MRHIAALILAISLSSSCACFLTRAEYEVIKSKATFETLSYETFLELFGTKDINKMIEIGEKIQIEEEELFEKYGKEYNSFLAEKTTVSLPQSHDWRQILPKCFKDIVKDQKYCGGCWAFATAEAFSERICIKHEARVSAIFSMQYLISCDKANYGCDGGNRYKAWEFLQNEGIPSTYCVPFESQNGIVPPCPNKCAMEELSFTKFKAPKSTIKFLKNASQVKEEVYKNGPVTAGMQTYADLSAYRGGIYKPATSRKTDRHAIVIVGWGVEDGVEHWIVQNSWGPKWGENGYFRIPMDICEISELVIIGDV